MQGKVPNETSASAMRRRQSIVLLFALLATTDALLGVRSIFRARTPLALSTAAVATPAAASVVAPPLASSRAKKDSDKAVPPKASGDDWLTLWRLSKVDWPLILAAFGGLLLAAAGEVATPALQSTVLNLALSGGSVNQLSGPITKLQARSVKLKFSV